MSALAGTKALCGRGGSEASVVTKIQELSLNV
jgi:hypothetical protein